MVPQTPDGWRNVWSAARMQEELCWTRSSLRKCIRPVVENGLRAHDDDPHVPVLNNRHGHERPCYDPGSQARRWTVFSSYLSFADFREANFQVTSSSWNSEGLCASGDSCFRSSGARRSWCNRLFTSTIRRPANETTRIVPARSSWQLLFLSIAADEDVRKKPS